MEKEDKELIDHLAEKLKSHELPYKEGAWEQFMAYEQQKQPAKPAKRILAPWLTAAAAAVILALGGLYFFQQKSAPDSITHSVTRTALAPGDKPTNSSPQGGQKQLAENASKKANRDQNTAANPAADGHSRQQNNNNLNTAEQALTTNSPYTPTYKSIHRGAYAPNNPINNQLVIPVTSDTNTSQHLLSAIDRLIPSANLRVANSYKNPLANNSIKTQTNNPVQNPLGRAQPAAQRSTNAIEQKQNNQLQPSRDQSTASSTESFNGNGYFDPNAPNVGNKWALGVMVIPAIGGDSKLNLGYGLSVGYRLNNRLSVNSGVSYNELSGSRNENSQSSIAGSSGRLLSSVDANVTGLNVPLELRYHVSKKIYVGAGVSALAVLSNKLERHYAVSEMQTSAFEAKNGHQLKPDEMKSIAANLTAKETIPEAQIDSKNFAGFMNFSFGFQQKINKTKSISIEPYISVPMSNHLSNQNIRLTDGGIRIKLGL